MERKIHVPDSIDTIDGGVLNFSDVQKTFANSHFGKYLAEQVRWARFKPDFIPNAEWCRAPLGADMNNLGHMALIGGMAKDYLRNQDEKVALNLTDSQIMVLAGETHDWAESVTTDVSFDQKTAIDDADEATIMLFLMKRTLGGKLAEETMKQIYKTVKDRTSRLGEIFNAIERVGYMRSGLNAWEASKKPEGKVMRDLTPAQEKVLRKNLKWLASNVAGNQVPAILKYAEKYHPVAKYVGNVRGRIDDLFAEMPASIFDCYLAEENGKTVQSQQMEKFLGSYDTWKKSKYSLEQSQNDRSPSKVVSST